MEDLSLVWHIDEDITFHPSEEERSQNLMKLRYDSSLLFTINDFIDLKRSQ